MVGAQVPRAHGDVGAPVGLAQDHGHLGHGGLGVGEQQLGPVPDDPAPCSWCGAGQVARAVGQGQQGDVEGVAEADEAGGLVRGVDVQAAGQAPAAGWRSPRRSGRRRARSRPRCSRANRLWTSRKSPSVHDRSMTAVHVVALAGLVGDQRVQLGAERGPAARSQAVRGGSSRLLAGRQDSRRRASAKAPPRRCQQEVGHAALPVVHRAPPSSSWLISSPITALTTSGPVMYMSWTCSP